MDGGRGLRLGRPNCGVAGRYPRLPMRICPRNLWITLNRWWLLAAGVVVAGSLTVTGEEAQQRTLRDYRDTAMRREGNVARGRALFAAGEKTACALCHTVDGAGGKAGPDLFAIGDKFPRRELIAAVLEPSATIAVGYGATTLETKAGETFYGVIKQVDAEFTALMGIDGKLVRVPTPSIKEQRESAVSLMPAGLQATMTTAEFTDLVEYLASLKQPEHSVAANRGMPDTIAELARPVAVRPILTDEQRFLATVVRKAGDVRTGLVWFGQEPGSAETFWAAEQVGRIWRLTKKADGWDKVPLADFTGEIFSQRGPNGLLGVVFHPQYRENRKYYLKHQVMEEGKIATVLEERRVTADFTGDSGEPARRILKIVSVTQDHSGGCIAFGPDGMLYLGMGDTGPQQDPNGHGQNLGLLLGKMLRIDVDHRTGDMAYAIPADNPFRGRADVRPEIWAYGFREPWRFSFDALTGELWVGDVGQDRVEEVDLVHRGENYGWNVYEGFEPFSNKRRQEGQAYTAPVVAYKRKYGNSVTGGYVYRGERASSFYGVYVFGDYTSRRIWGLTQENGRLKAIRQIGMSPEGIASFATDGQGRIYVVGYEGGIFEVDFSAGVFEAGGEK